MSRRKTIVVIAVVAALTLAIAGSAYAVTTGGSQGYLGASDISGAAVSAQNGNAQGPGTTCTDCGDPDRARDQEQAQDGTGDNCTGTCDGTCDGVCDGTGAQVVEAQSVGSEPETALRAQTQTQARTGECGGICEQVQTQTQAQVQTQTQIATRQCQPEGACEGDGPYGPGGPDTGPGPNAEPGTGAGPASAGNGPGPGAGVGNGTCTGTGNGAGR